jgi:hypothetical protein
MSARFTRSLSVAALLVAVAACNVDVVDCDTEDASICDDDEDLFDGGGIVDDEDAGSSGDGGDGGDGGAVDDPDSSTTPTDDGGADDGSVPVELSVEEFCAARYAVALAWRDALENQCPSASTASDDRADFLGVNLGYGDNAIDTCVTSTNDLITKKQVSYAGRAAQGCADAYNAQFSGPPASFPAQGVDIGTAAATVGHGAASPAQIPQCRAALVGKLALGAVCPTSVACVDGLRCLSAPGGGRTCQRPLDAGGQCSSAGDCSDDTRCVKSTSSSTGKVCVAKDDLRISQGSCDSSVECASGLVCNASNRCETAQPAFICGT